MLSGTLGTSLLGNILAGKGINRAGEGVIRVGYDNKNGETRKREKRDKIVKTKWIFNAASSFNKF